MDLKQIHLYYITNERGDKTAVILPIATFQELLEDLSDLAAVVERKDEPTISHEQLIASLRGDGTL